MALKFYKNHYYLTINSEVIEYIGPASISCDIKAKHIYKEDKSKALYHFMKKHIIKHLGTDLDTIRLLYIKD